MKSLLTLGMLIGGAAGAAWHYQDQIAAVVEPATSPSVQAKSVTNPSSKNERIYATGFVEGARQTAELRFELMGRLEEILVTEGQKVEKGQVLAQLDSALLGQQVAQAEADLNKAKAEWLRLKNAARPETREVARSQVQVAKAELERLREEAARTKRLYDQGVASEQEWLDAFHPLQIAQARLAEKQALAAEVEAPARSDDLEVAQSQIEVAQAALTHARLRLEKTKLIAPTDGTVLHVSSELGELVGPNDSDPLFLFANLDSIRVRAYVEEFHAMSISQGDRVQVTADGLPDKQFAGTVIYCSSSMHEKQHRTHKPNEFLDVRTREIVIELKDAEGLVVGLPVEVIITPDDNVGPENPPESPAAVPYNHQQNEPQA